MTLKRTLSITLGAFVLLTATALLLANHYRHELYRASIDHQANGFGLHTKTIDAAGITWSYMENNLKGQKPSLMMIHGFGSSKETWLPMTEYLAQDYHLVLIDLPGHGQSTFDPNRTYTLEGQAELVHQFANAIGLDQFNLIGNSMGGGVTGVYAGTYPDQLLSAIMLDPAGIVVHRSDYLERIERGENPLLVETVDDLDFVFEYAVAEKITIPWPFNQVLVDNAIQRRPNLDKVFADLTADPTHTITRSIAQITAPTLVMWGKEDRLIHPDNAALFQQANPIVQIKMLDNVGHIPMVEIPQACADMVQRFTQQFHL